MHTAHRIKLMQRGEKLQVIWKFNSLICISKASSTKQKEKKTPTNKVLTTISVFMLCGQFEKMAEADLILT